MDIEFDFIKEAITKLNDNQKNEITKNLDSYFEFFNKHTPNNKALDGIDIFKKLIELPKFVKVKCPLLIDNKCSIYSNRPLTCRIHIVENKPEICVVYPNRDSTQKAKVIRHETVNYLKHYMEVNIIPLPYIVSEAIDPNRKLKPLKKITI